MLLKLPPMYTVSGVGPAATAITWPPHVGLKSATMVPLVALNAKMPDRAMSADVAVCDAGEVPAHDHHVANLRDVVHRAVLHVWGPRRRRGGDHAVVGVEG